MSDKMTTSERLINEFAENYVEKLFYFCLKKTGNKEDAEELTQDIAYNILYALNGGTIPKGFSAWVWQIARNRYARWAKSKHRARERFTGDPIEEMELADDERSILEEMIEKEQLSLLRRELAFIKSEYRNIVVAYYIDNESIRHISEKLSLSVSTVQQRLHRARSILKEGMNMAREFGVRSYKPEEVGFTNSCSSFGENGQPWTILNHGMYKNIFLEAYGNPSTAEELSLELGIALPYMEEELEYLTRETFLIKEGNKYKTSFPIIGKEAQVKIWSYNCRAIPPLTTLLEKLLDDYIKICNAHGIHPYGDFVSYEDAKWTLLMKAFDKFAYENRNKHSYTKRPNGGNWDIVGFQNADIPSIPYTGLHGCDSTFMQYKFKYKDIMMKTPEYLDHDEAMAIKAVAEGKWEICDKKALERLMEYGYVVKTDLGYEPTIVVFGMKLDKYTEGFTAEEQALIAGYASEIRKIFADTTEYAERVTIDDLPNELKNDERMCKFACSNNKLARNYILDQALKDGWIKYDDATSKVIGAHIYV